MCKKENIHKGYIGYMKRANWGYMGEDGVIEDRKQEKRSGRLSL
jgi:hypothetical protein